MRLNGIHHVTCITGDAQLNVDFYARLLGLRLVKLTVNYDAPDVYHLYFGDELGHPGSILTFFEFPGAPPGRAGAGMIHRLVWHVGSRQALDFWARRLEGEGRSVERADSTLLFSDPEGLDLELTTAGGAADRPLTAEFRDIPREQALQGFDGVRAYGRDPGATVELLTETLGARRLEEASPQNPNTLPGNFHSGFPSTRARAGRRAARKTRLKATRQDVWGVELRGEDRGGRYTLDDPLAVQPLQGAGTVHHIAWASRDADHAGWRDRILAAGVSVTPVIDRTYFRSIYFREPGGVLFEIATQGPGFTVDEPAEELGQRLVLPAVFEAMRPRLERTLRPVRNPRLEPARS